MRQPPPVSDEPWWADQDAPDVPLPLPDPIDLESIEAVLRDALKHDIERERLREIYEEESLRPLIDPDVTHKSWSWEVTESTFTPTGKAFFFDKDAKTIVLPAYGMEVEELPHIVGVDADTGAIVRSNDPMPKKLMTAGTVISPLINRGLPTKVHDIVFDINEF